MGKVTNGGFLINLCSLWHLTICLQVNCSVRASCWDAAKVKSNGNKGMRHGLVQSSLWTREPCAQKVWLVYFQGSG